VALLTLAMPPQVTRSIGFNNQRLTKIFRSDELMKVLVLGATGMLGHKLVQVLGKQFQVMGTVRGDPTAYQHHPVLEPMTLIGKVQADDFDSVIRAFAAVQPEAVINGIGLIKQRPGATNPLPSIMLNALWPHRLAQLCRAASARLIHISTDCVFSGRKGNYTEDDRSDAEDLYGRTKFLGEVSDPGCLTLRTSIVGRELGTCSGLIEWFLSQRGGAINGYTRAIYTGLTTQVLTELIGDLLVNHPGLSGLWQVSSEPISKYDLLQLVNRTLGIGVTIHRDESFVCDRSLNGARFCQRVGYIPPSWPTMVKQLADDPTPYDQMRYLHVS